MQRQKNEPVVLADTSRLTFPERLEYQKLGIMADDLPIIHLNNRMEKAEYESVLGLFLKKSPGRPKKNWTRRCACGSPTTRNGQGPGLRWPCSA